MLSRPAASMRRGAPNFSRFGGDATRPRRRRAQRLVSPRRRRREEGSAPRAHHKVVAPSVGEDCCSEGDRSVIRVVRDVDGALGDL